MNNIIKIIFIPSCWIRIGHTCKDWDFWLRNALKDPQFEYLSKYTVKLNGKEIWIANYPYGYGSEPCSDALPKRSTVFLLKKYVDRWLINNGYSQKTNIPQFSEKLR